MGNKNLDNLYEKNRELMKEIREYREKVVKDVRTETAEILNSVSEENKKITKVKYQKYRTMDEYRETFRLQTPNLKISLFPLLENIIENATPQKISKELGWNYNRASYKRAQLKNWLRRIKWNNWEKIESLKNK